VAMLCCVQGKTLVLVLLYYITGYYAFHGRTAGDAPFATLGSHTYMFSNHCCSHYTDWIVIFQAS